MGSDPSCSAKPHDQAARGAGSDPATVASALGRDARTSTRTGKAWRVLSSAGTGLAKLFAEALGERLHLELLAGDVGEQLVGVQSVSFGPKLAKHSAGLSIRKPD
jgi:hypothetical protein